MLKWTLHKHVMAYCTACLKWRLHQIGHFAGRKDDYRICVKCGLTTEVRSEEQEQ